jgi:hypothetical protein
MQRVCSGTPAFVLFGGRAFLAQYGQKSDQQKQHVHDGENNHYLYSLDTTDLISKPVRIE